MSHSKTFGHVAFTCDESDKQCKARERASKTCDHVNTRDAVLPLSKKSRLQGRRRRELTDGITYSSPAVRTQSANGSSCPSPLLRSNGKFNFFGSRRPGIINPRFAIAVADLSRGPLQLQLWILSVRPSPGCVSGSRSCNLRDAGKLWHEGGLTCGLPLPAFRQCHIEIGSSELLMRRACLDVRCRWIALIAVQTPVVNCLRRQNAELCSL